MVWLRWRRWLHGNAHLCCAAIVGQQLQRGEGGGFGSLELAELVQLGEPAEYLDHQPPGAAHLMFFGDQQCSPLQQQPSHSKFLFAVTERVWVQQQPPRDTPPGRLGLLG